MNFTEDAGDPASTPLTVSDPPRSAVETGLFPPETCSEAMICFLRPNSSEILLPNKFWGMFEYSPRPMTWVDG